MIIKERKAELIEFNNEAFKVQIEPLIDILIEGHFAGEYREGEVRQHVETFISAGFDTTALALAYSVFLLIHYQDKQEKLFKEIQSIIETDLVRDKSAQDTFI